MINAILNILYKSKIFDIKIIKNKNLYSENIIIVTAISEKHIKYLANSIIKILKKEHFIVSGQNTGWIIIDINTITLHIMLETTRSIYALELLYENNN